MPVRRYSRGAAAGSAAAGAVSDVLGDVLKRRQAQQIGDENALRNDTLERGRTADALIASGKLSPKDRDAYIRGTYTGPSVSDRVSSIMGGIDKASSPETTPTRIALGEQIKAADLPMQFGQMTTPSVTTSEDFGSGVPAPDATKPTLPSRNYGPVSPDAERIMSALNQKEASFPPTQFPETMQGSGDSLQKVTTPQRWNRNTQQFEATPAYASGPTAGQQGGFTGTAGATAENIERPAKIATATQTTTADTQARIDTETSPANTAAEARRSAAIASAVEKARQDLVAQGVSPEMATNFISHTNTGKPYISMDPTVPMEIRKGVLNRVYADPALRDAKVVSKEESDALKGIDESRTNLAHLMHSFADKLGANADARLVTASRNTLNAMLQFDPELKAAVDTYYGPSIQLFRSTLGQMPGLRMTQTELASAKAMLPLMTDSWPTALYKMSQLGDILETQEERILRK